MAPAEFATQEDTQMMVQKKAILEREGFWREAEFSKAKEELPAKHHMFQFQSELRYNTTHDVYRPSTVPDYVGPPSPEMDAAWEELIGAVNVFVTPEEAATFPDAKFWMDPETGLYMAQVTVIHDLHCINFIRKTRHLDYYNSLWTTGTNAHVEHCLDSLRHSIMCTADMTLIPVEWSASRNWLMPKFKTTHSCRDYRTIRTWSVDRESADSEVYHENAERYYRTGSFSRTDGH